MQRPWTAKHPKAKAAEPDVEAFVTKLLSPVYKTKAADVAAKFVAAGEAAITAL